MARSVLTAYPWYLKNRVGGSKRCLNLEINLHRATEVSSPSHFITLISGEQLLSVTIKDHYDIETTKLAGKQGSPRLKINKHLYIYIC